MLGSVILKIRDNQLNVIRVIFAVVIIISSLHIVRGVYAASQYEAEYSSYKEQSEKPFAERTPVVEPREGVTVVSKGALRFRTGELLALAPDGRVLYLERKHYSYGDVDPSPKGELTVSYVAHDQFRESCGTTVCTRTSIERLNLSTGEREVLYQFATPKKDYTRWHDADRLDTHRFVVAGIDRDRVFIVNTTTNLVEWQWDAQSTFNLSSGGPWPSDWTHINDVEVLPDSRIMVSVRNHDQVVFLDPGSGVDEEWTLGTDGNHRILYAQHNPDYIPAENGGPAVLVSDSENNRLVEYQRENGKWVRSWVWQHHTDWPRDGDRLPNGHTLVTDTGGSRVIEINETGHIVWNMTANSPYEAERLNTGPESFEGPSAKDANLPSRVVGKIGPAAGGEGREMDDTNPLGRIWALFLSLLIKIRNAVMFFTPRGIGLSEIAAAIVLIGTTVTWGGIEVWLRLRDYLTIRWPITINR